MEKQHSNLFRNLVEPKSDILKKRLLKTNTASIGSNHSLLQTSQQNVLLNTLRATSSTSMIVSSVQAPHSSIPLTHNLISHSLAPVKIHASNTSYPIQLSTVHVPVQIPGSNSNINVPVQLSGPTCSVPLQITPVGLPIQGSCTTNVPVQLPAGETINVPLQLPTTNQSIQLTGSSLPSMPLLQSSNQQIHNSIIHVHMGSTTRTSGMDGASDISISNTPQVHISDSINTQMKLSSATAVSQVQVTGTSSIVQIPSSSNNPIQLALPNSGTVQLRGAGRNMPHVVYIQTPSGLKSVSSSEVISQASSSGNPPQIIVRRPMTSNSNIQLLSNNVNTKPNIAPKLNTKSSLLAHSNAQPIVIQKPKEKVIVPVTIPGSQTKPALAYLGPIKKTNQKLPDNQSILISNNQNNTNNQKLFITPMNMPKIQNTKFLLPVTMPATMASKGPIINLQISNGQIQNDPQGNITVMRETGNSDGAEMPPLQPLAKNINGKETSNKGPQTEKSFSSDKSYAVSIPGSRAEPTGEQGEYTLSIPETNASMNDDIYTVSMADDEGGHSREKSFTLAIPEKGKSLLNRNIIDKNDMASITVTAAPAILRRSNSEHKDRKMANANLKRRISLCNDNFSNKFIKNPPMQFKVVEKQDEHVGNIDDHRVPSLFCDEKLDKDLDIKTNVNDPNTNDVETQIACTRIEIVNSSNKKENYDIILEEDPPGFIWNNGIAQLHGSNLRFQTNEFGLIDLIDNNQVQNDFVANTSSKYQTPLKQRIDRNSREKKPTSPEDMYRCDGCGCHGMAAEFITPNFCSLTCQSEVQKMLQKKRDKERSELNKKRNKMKKLLMKKQHSDSDIVEKDERIYRNSDYGSESQISETMIMKINDDMVENKKYPWMCGKNGFSWMRYLDVCKAKAAPVKIFKDPFPYNRNGFKVGMRLEAIDPQHASLFCVATVVEVQGYRMRLHFDEYPDMYDWWVNADCIDIFPPGWCEKNGRNLTFPVKNFSWPLYLKSKRAIAAPKHLFLHIDSCLFKPNGFRIGMKLEAEDRKNQLVCVSSVKDVLDNRLLITFDSWDDMYDYWADPASPFIHPVGWASENGLPLTPPNSSESEKPFSWEEFLQESGCPPAPPRAFKPRGVAGFKTGMKLEVVDPRVPFLIRVASVSDVKGHQLRISFDGWADELSLWMDDDSPDIHPVGWCLKTGHPLEPPLTEEEGFTPGPCGFGGCRGLGSVAGAGKQHATSQNCPYLAPHPRPLPHRLRPRDPDSDAAEPLSIIAKPLRKPLRSISPASDTSRDNSSQISRPPKHKRVEEITKPDIGSDDDSMSSGGKRWRRTSETRVKEEDEDEPMQMPKEHMQSSNISRWHDINKHIEELELPKDPTTWTKEHVSALIERIGGAGAGSAAADARLSGRDLIMASRVEIATHLRLRLGPALKIYSAIRQLRQIVA